MVGRAGRYKLDKIGFGYLLVKDPEKLKKQESQYILGNPEPIKSNFSLSEKSTEVVSPNLIHTLLQVINTEMFVSAQEISIFLEYTFFGYLNEEKRKIIKEKGFSKLSLFDEIMGIVNIEEVAESYTSYLEDMNMITQKGRLKTTLRGRIAVNNNVNPVYLNQFLEDLETINQSSNELFILWKLCRDFNMYFAHPIPRKKSKSIVERYFLENNLDIVSLITSQYPNEYSVGVMSIEMSTAAMSLYINENDTEAISEILQLYPGSIERTRIELLRVLKVILDNSAELGIFENLKVKFTELHIRIFYGITNKRVPFAKIFRVGRQTSISLSEVFETPFDLLVTPVEEIEKIELPIINDKKRTIGAKNASKIKKQAEIHYLKLLPLNRSEIDLDKLNSLIEDFTSLEDTIKQELSNGILNYRNNQPYDTVRNCRAAHEHYLALWCLKDSYISQDDYKKKKLYSAEYISIIGSHGIRFSRTQRTFQKLVQTVGSVSSHLKEEITKETAEMSLRCTFTLLEEYESIRSN